MAARRRALLVAAVLTLALAPAGCGGGDGGSDAGDEKRAEQSVTVWIPREPA